MRMSVQHDGKSMHRTGPPLSNRAWSGLIGGPSTQPLSDLGNGNNYPHLIYSAPDERIVSPADENSFSLLVWQLFQRTRAKHRQMSARLIGWAGATHDSLWPRNRVQKGGRSMPKRCHSAAKLTVAHLGT